MFLAQGNNTPTRVRIEPGSPDPESDALTTRPVRPPGVFSTDEVRNLPTQPNLTLVFLLYNTIISLLWKSIVPSLKIFKGHIMNFGKNCVLLQCYKKPSILG